MIDTHAHIDGDEFLDDLDQVLENAKDNGITKIFIPNINMDTINRIIQLSDTYPDFLYPMIGIHPEDVNTDKNHMDKCLCQIRNMLNDDKEGPKRFIAIGEVGLDLYWDQSFKDLQIYVFEKQVQMAVEFNIPLMIHSRNAHKELIHVLNPYKDITKGVFHCFTGTEEEAEELLDFKNFFLGVGGVSTFKKSILPQTLKNVVPVSKIVVETDSPYLSPHPLRGTVNEPKNIALVIDEITRIKGLSKKHILDVVYENSCKLFNV